jgi:predicted GIY-YIG superfamily endonuclease
LTRHSGPTWVYLIYCEKDCLLYVGVTNDVDRRLYVHQETWGKEFVIARVEMHLYDTKAEALQVERELIRTLWPRFNMAGHPFRWWEYFKQRRDYGHANYRPCHGEGAWNARDMVSLIEADRNVASQEAK